MLSSGLMFWLSLQVQWQTHQHNLHEDAWDKTWVDLKWKLKLNVTTFSYYLSMSARFCSFNYLVPSSAVSMVFELHFCAWTPDLLRILLRTELILSSRHKIALMTEYLSHPRTRHHNQKAFRRLLWQPQFRKGSLCWNCDAHFRFCIISRSTNINEGCLSLPWRGFHAVWFYSWYPAVCSFDF